ncbi:UTRA domain-containing protein [Pontixanthobacter sp. CEM42]|uniref:GntR family transcriptional regulator n=1 Tax=Pontixanthobacter sp. CEM42 TaxID=2792077 RepID=UPI001AE0E6FD|nr:UTRA domain-containing protein [Pontixanthobacter sp. CEM42]
MSSMSHQTIRKAVLDRIQSGEWPLGALIPGEVELAEEYGCARTTVNRALRTLAEEGLVVRKRKGGTRICAMPVRQAKFEIPIIREQVEAGGSTYGHRVITRTVTVPPSEIAERLSIPSEAEALHLTTLHMAGEEPYAWEDRWVNVQAVPAIADAPLETISANEWLVQSVPLSSGDVRFSAENASKAIAETLGAEANTALFRIDRTTWLEDQTITTMTLYYHEGFQLTSQL